MTTPSYSTLPPGRLEQSCFPIPWDAPREWRVGGYVMTHKTAEEWAARILGVQYSELDIDDAHCATMYINDRIKPYRAKLSMIGEDLGNIFCMIITHCARFRGRVGMPDKEIPQFAPNEADDLARELLLAQGVEESDFQFQTWLS
ncbi:hypothetical protein FPV67DRAFT_1781076 [Lyophyllum atratum]|nr:hypothetical protein FPV67DRAFT_1781076 [Lyophyllum atratum]